MSKSGLRGRILRFCQKELKETIRDRRTIVTLLLMPLLVYPLLSMALNRFVLASGAVAGDGYTVCVMSEEERLQLDEWLNDPRSLPPEAILESSGNDLANFRVTVIPNATPDKAVENNDVDVGVKIEGMKSATPVATFFAYRGNPASQAARRILIERLQWLRMSDADFVLRTAIPQYTPPVDVKVTDVGEAKKSSMLGTIVPLVLVLMTITGAVYPAIDLTAGERERGTMESVMASPVPRGYVLFSKYIAVVVVSLLTAVANLLAMFTTLWAGGLLPLLSGGEEFPWIAVFRILGLLVLFSGFFSALLLSLTSFAKSFKEAQAYLIPVMLVSLTPAMLSLMPDANLSGALAIVPLINIVLLARDLLSGSVDPVGALAAIVSTIAYAAAALTIAARLFGSDAVTRTSEKSIGSLLQRPQQASDVPSAQAAAMMLALLVPIYFVVSNGLMRFLQQVKETVSVETQLIFNAAALILTFGMVPLMAAVLGRNRLRTTFRIRMPSSFRNCSEATSAFQSPSGESSLSEERGEPSPAVQTSDPPASGRMNRARRNEVIFKQSLSLVGAAFLGLGAWAFAHEAFVIADALGIGGLGEEQIANAKVAIERMRQAPPLLLLAVFALAPAVIEELCFRGYLFSALRDVLSPWRTIVATAVLFGLFHVLTGSALLVERFIPSTLMGLIIGWVAYRTESVVPGMVIHFVHNGLLNLVLYYQDKLSFLGDGLDNQTHLPATWIGAALLLVVIGCSLVWASTRGLVKAADKKRGQPR